MKNTRTLGFGLLAAIACFAVAGCATDEAATCSDSGACAEKASCGDKTSCADKAAGCSEKGASECCAKKDAATKN